MRLALDPLDVPLNVRVGLEGFERVVIALQLLVVGDDVYVPVPKGTEVNCAVYLPPVERGLSDEIGSLEHGMRADILADNGTLLQDMRALHEARLMLRKGLKSMPE